MDDVCRTKAKRTEKTVKTSRLSISAYFNICFALTFIAASILVIAIVNRSMHNEALSGAEERTNVLLERNLATHHYFSQELKPKLFDTIAVSKSQDYFEPIWMSSTYAIRQIDKYFNSNEEYSDYYYKECAINARSPQNEADDYERAFIEELNKKPDLPPRSEIRKFDGQAYFVTLRRGETMEQSCLKCHSTPDKAPGDLITQYGSQRSFNRNAGDIVSAVSIRVPLANAYAATRATTIKLSILLLAILSLMLSTQYFFTKKTLLKPLKLLQKKSTEISFDPKHLGDMIPMPYSKELGEVVSAFNNMSVKLRSNTDLLEQKILERTNELENSNQQLVAEINDRKDKEAKVSDQKVFLEQIIESLSHPFYVIDANDFTVKLANSASGLQEPSKETTCYAMTHKSQKPCDEAEHICPVKQIKQTKKTATVEHIHYDKQGKAKIIEVHAYPVIDKNGNVAQIIEYSLDITERKHTQEQIENLAKFPSENPNPVLRIATDGKLLYTNEAAKSLVTEWRCQVGQTVPSHWHNIIADAFQKGTEQRIQIEHDGKAFSFAITPVIDANYANLYGRDVTERKQAMDDLEIAKEHAEAANIAKSQFLANMSHEIRTPMSVITGFSDMLVTEELTKDQLVCAQLIQNAGKSLLTIINDILDYSKIEAGKLKIAPADYSLKSILDDVDDMMRPLAVKKDLLFEIICSETLPAIIQTDEDRLHQCLVNLVSNAIKFTNAGHVHLKVSIEDKDANSFIRFDVEDTGIGIPPDMREHIFDSFTQVEKGNTRKHGGTGLGLTITNQLAGLLGGQVSFTSAEGVGSIFSLVIPAGVHVASLPSLKKQPVHEIIPTKEEAHLFSGKVMIADDDKGCQVLTTKLLQRLGLEVTIANNGKEAIEKTMAGSFNLIFMDVRMPGLSGFEATEALHKKGISIPIIALTAHAMEGDRELCIQAGCDDYLSKPIEHEKLLQILDRYLTEKQLS